MELTAVRKISSPTTPGRVRLVGEVVYEAGPRAGEEYWFEVSEQYAGSLSQSGNPWLVCLAPLAATLGERLRINLPVDRLLYRNVREVLAIWRAWYPQLHAVDLQAETVDGFPEARGEKTGATFSGGVDSFFTVLRGEEPGGIRVDELINVGGFDIPLSNLSAFERRRDRMAAAAAELGKTLVDVVTNLRQTRLERTGWGSLWHGAGLASVGLALEGRYCRFVISSTHPYVDLFPLGSHPMTDPLLSTSRTDVLHEGSSYTRADKVEHVVRSTVALRNLHVCFRMGSDYNCGACEKCLRTMAMLDVLGVLPSASSFSEGRVDPKRLARVLVKRATQEGYYRALRALAVSRGRHDIVRAVDLALRGSRWRRVALRFPDWLGKRRGLWRAARPVRRVILAGELV